MKLENLKKLVERSVFFKVEEVLPNVFNVRFKNQKDLCSTFVRLQEYYESPNFRNKIFSLEEFHNWYSKQHKGKFTYLKDWTGFNIPSNVAKEVNKKFSLNKREKQLISVFKRKKKPYYVIGTFGSKKDYKSVLKHEIAHAMYHNNLSYKKEINKILKDINKKKLFKFLEKLGYHKKVWLDEAHAFILTEYEDLISSKVNISKKHKKSIDETFEKYLKKVA